MTDAEAASCSAEAAPRDGAGSQRGHARDHWPGIAEERLELRASPIEPAPVVALAEPLGGTLPITRGNPAGLEVEDERARRGDHDLGSELGSDRGHQLRQQTLPVLVFGQCGRAHQVTSFPVSSPAFSRALRASSTLRWP
jgi:hypothetical protein